MIPLALALTSAAQEPHTVAVTGTGQVRVVPDEAVVRLGVWVDAESASEAYAQAARQMDEVVKALRREVPKEALRTEHVALTPVYRHDEGEPQLTGYRAASTLSVRVDEPTDAGRVLDAAVRAGANEVQGIEYAVEEPGAAREQALDAALADAQRTARHLAAALGGQLGPALSVDLREPQAPGPMPLGLERADMAVLPGEQTWTVTVDVTWALEPSPGVR